MQDTNTSSEVCVVCNGTGRTAYRPVITARWQSREQIETQARCRLCLGTGQRRVNQPDAQTYA